MQSSCPGKTSVHSYDDQYERDDGDRANGNEIRPRLVGVRRTGHSIGHEIESRVSGKRCELKGTIHEYLRLELGMQLSFLRDR